MLSLQLTYTCPLAQAALDKTNYITIFNSKKNVEAVLVRLCPKQGLRFFIRESLGNSQHVAWLGEKELKEWGQSHMITYHKWSTEGISNEKTFYKNNEAKLEKNQRGTKRTNQSKAC